MDNRAIGVFDSGIGGLTALSDLIEKFPNEDFLYLADTLNCPYGLKTKSEIEQIVSDNVQYFERQNVKAIIIACNTATANSFHIKTNIPTIRIIEPTIKTANKVSNHIAILATNFTIDSGIYQKGLNGEAIGVRCSEFVGIVEEGKMNTPYSYDLVKNKLSNLIGKVDTLILGCTHFGLLTSEIKAVFKDITIIDSSLSIAPVLSNILDSLNLRSNNNIGKVYLKTTGDPYALKIDWFSKELESLEKINIYD
jgi:glutamate racemase